MGARMDARTKAEGETISLGESMAAGFSGSPAPFSDLFEWFRKSSPGEEQAVQGTVSHAVSAVARVRSTVEKRMPGQQKDPP